MDEIILEIFYNRNDSIVLRNVVDKEMRHFKREVFNLISTVLVSCLAFFLTDDVPISQ